MLARMPRPGVPVRERRDRDVDLACGARPGRRPGRPGIAASVYGARSACTRSMSWTSCAALSRSPRNGSSSAAPAGGSPRRARKLVMPASRNSRMSAFGAGVGAPDAREVRERRDIGLAQDEAQQLERAPAGRAAGAVRDGDEARTRRGEVPDRLVEGRRRRLRTSAGTPRTRTARGCAQVDGHVVLLGSERRMAGRPRIAHPAVGRRCDVIAGGCRARLSLHARPCDWSKDRPCGRPGDDCSTVANGRVAPAPRVTSVSAYGWSRDDDDPLRVLAFPAHRRRSLRGVAAPRRRALRRRRDLVGRVRAGGGRAHDGAPARRHPATVVDVLPPPWNARSRVHEYGGGAWTTDGRRRARLRREGRPARLDRSPTATARGRSRPPTRGMRFGGLTWQGGRLLAIRETHRDGAAPQRDIVEVPLDRTGAWDAVGHPVADRGQRLPRPARALVGRLAPRLDRLEPPEHAVGHAPSCGSGALEDGIVAEWTTVAGGDGTAPLQPVWTGEDDLVYSDDPTGRWNLWRLRLTADLHHEADRSRRCRHRRPALGARRALVRRAGRRPHRRRAHERRRRGRRDRRRRRGDAARRSMRPRTSSSRTSAARSVLLIGLGRARLGRALARRRRRSGRRGARSRAGHRRGATNGCRSPAP